MLRGNDTNLANSSMETAYLKSFHR